MIHSSDSLHLLPCHFNDPSRGWPALRLAPISPCLLPVVAFSNFIHTHTFVTNSQHFDSRLSHKNENKMTQLLTRHHLRPHLVRNLKCMLYTLFRLHIASGSEKIKSIHMCLKNMYWLGQQCDSSGYRYTVCRKYLQYLLLYLHLTLPHQWQKQNHISSALIPFERSQSLEVRPWRLEVWQLQNIFGSRGF